MFGVFGEITFTVLSGPCSLESSRNWDYAEHRVVEDRPRLQWIGDGLERISLEMMFHASFTNPTIQLAALLAAASDHNARALVFGNGDHRGYFVLISLRTTSKQMSDEGDIVQLSVLTGLTEWAPGLELDANAAPRPTFTPIGIASLATAASSSAGAGPAYNAPILAATGVSTVLNTAAVFVGPSAGLLPEDISPSVIVRGAT